MKRNILLAVVIVLLIVSSCKKTNEKKDVSTSFKNTVWTGSFNYTGGAVQPVSIEFSEGGQLTWHEPGQDFSGTWTLADHLLTVFYAGLSNGFTADISDDSKLTNIKIIAGSNWVMVEGGLNTNPEPVLDNTSWTGTNIVINFKAGSKLDLILGPTAGTVYSDIPYFHKGRAIRFSPVSAYHWFIVNINSSTFKGANSFAPDPTTYLFNLNKK